MPVPDQHTGRAAAAGIDLARWPAVEPVPSASTLWEAVEQGASNGTEIVFVDAELNERRVGYAELRDRATIAAGALRDSGLMPGDRVCLAALTSPELLSTLLGCWRAGLVPTLSSLPVSSDVSAWLDALRARAELVGAAVILTDEALAGLIGTSVVADRTLVFQQLLAGSAPLEEPLAARPDDVAYLQFTSGSTGVSRAVALGHTQILWNVCHDINGTGELGPDEVRASWLPLYHDFGLIFFLAAVASGAPLILQSPDQFVQRPGSWMDACSRYRAVATAGPSSTYGLAARELTLNPRGLDLSALRLVLNGSEPIDMDTMDRFTDVARQYGLPETAPTAAYGLAECTLAVAWTRPADLLGSVFVQRDGLGERGCEVRQGAPGASGVRRLASCGRPDDATEIRILSEEGEPLPPWRVGEITVRGPSVMIGYWNDPEATADTLRDGWLCTGDLGFLTGEGELVPCGRIKDMIIVGGRNLYPEDYEFVAERLPGIRKGSAIAFSLPDAERMVLVVETKQAADESASLAKTVRDRMRDEFDPPPSEVLLVPAGTVPKTSSGKRQRRLCRELYEAGDLQIIDSAGG